MCLSTVFERRKDGPDTCLLRNVANVRVEPEQIIFTDLMGARTVYTGRLYNMDLIENTITVSKDE